MHWWWVAWDRLVVSLCIRQQACCRLWVANNQPLSPDFFLRTGPGFTGPWGKPVAAFRQLSSSSDGFNYAGIEHPELAKHGGRTIYVSYFNTTGFLAGNLRLVEVNFA